MNILIFGESCTEKSTLASKLKEPLDMDVYTGKDYLRLSKNKDEAKNKFISLLGDDSENIIFIATEKDEVDMVQDTMIKVLAVASLDTKMERFVKRFKGHLLKPVERMIKRKHGMFDDYDYNFSVNEKISNEEVIGKIKKLM
ncbi:MAG TPA: hypothetical protein VJ878_02540 [Candidatus Izemoplasmatales bacterium]|nr:hypothetical protein [Candidatus Izemoplasmatales bacterium]